MELTSTHLRYLLTMYELAKQGEDHVPDLQEVVRQAHAELDG